MNSVKTKPNKVYILILPFLCGILSSSAQIKLDEIQIAKIDCKKIVEFIDLQKASNVIAFDEIQASLEPDSSTEGFHVTDNEYLVKERLPDVWDHYVNCDLQNSWNSKRVHMCLAYSRANDELYYSSDTVEKLIPGLIVFFDLKVLVGLKEIAMAFEVTRIDPDEKLIEFSYIKGNQTLGKQQMYFESTPKGYTLITHLSYYKSKPKPRERIYPQLHAQLINRFHRNMKRKFASYRNETED